MDIDYLLLLQDLREGILGGTFNGFAEGISDFIISPFPYMVAAFIYWLIDKNAGGFFFFNLGFSKTLNELVKLTACVYRPWIKDSRVLPAGTSKTTATGYSFPSGHTTIAGATYGGLAYWQWKERKWVSVCAIILILLTLFSRNFLGVHTPQDVIVGITMSIGMLAINIFIWRFVSKKSVKTQTIIVILALVFCALVLVYFEFKPYKLDYVEGSLLVDPKKMIPDGYDAVGIMAGFLIAWLIDKWVIKYKVPRNTKTVILLAILLVIPMFYMHYNLVAVLNPLVGNYWAHFLRKVLIIIYAMNLVPLILRKCNK